MAKRIVLAYSGGLDTSVLVRWMTEEMGAEVIALAVDLGQGGDWDAVRARAVAAGAAEVEVADAKKEFASDFVAPAISAERALRGEVPANQLPFEAGNREAPCGRGPPPRCRRHRPRVYRKR